MTFDRKVTQVVMITDISVCVCVCVCVWSLKCYNVLIQVKRALQPVATSKLAMNLAKSLLHPWFVSAYLWAFCKNPVKTATYRKPLGWFQLTLPTLTTVQDTLQRPPGHSLCLDANE